MKLLQGDCLEKMKELPEAAIIVTDPPFNVGYHYNTYKDLMDDVDYYDMLFEVIGERDCVIIHYPEQLHRISIRFDKTPERVISWVYNSNTARQHRDIAFYGIKPDFSSVGQPYKNPTDKRVKKLIEDGRQARLYDWWDVNQVKNVSKEKTKHTCQMPELIMDRIIKMLPKDRIIIDPFMGSGTTGVACVNNDREFIGIELDEEYIKIAKARIAHAQKEKDGKLL